MEKFRFSLDTLLRVRKERENEARKDLLAAYLNLKKQKGKLEYLLKSKDKIQNDMRVKRGRLFDPATIIALDQCQEEISARIEKQLRLIRSAEASVELSRKKVVAAMRNRKIIENLKEKKFTEWQAEYMSKEKAFYDEIAMNEYTRKPR